MSGKEILLVDDDGDGCLSLARALKATGMALPIHAATTAEQAWSLMQAREIAVVVLDLSLDDRRGVESGFEVLQGIVKAHPHLRVIILTGHGGIEHGVRALNLGAANFLEKPAHIPHLVALIHDGVAQSTLRQAALTRERALVEETLVGSSEATHKLREAIEFAARTSQAIFLSGETGAGKGLCAQLIHRLSKRSVGNYVRYQPNFSSADLVNSDLFGHRKGAFTGATDDRRGLLRDADGGTLFLDEIDELPLECQVTLLGVLQERAFRPVGASALERSDFRLITASNCNIEAALSQGKMRRDFYHRVAQAVVQVPSLRERREDISAIAQHVLAALSRREEMNLFQIDEAVVVKLKAYDWPGNVRELQSVIEGAAFRAQYRGASAIELVDIPELVGGISRAGQGEFIVGADFASQVDNFKIKLIESALVRHDGNQVRAAQELALDRSTMRRILARGNSRID